MEHRKNRRLRESFIRHTSNIIREMKDHRLHEGIITICDARVSSDASFCKIYISSLNGMGNAKKICKILNYASGYIQSQLSSNLRLRISPKILFIPSNSEEYAFKIENMISMSKLDNKKRLHKICDFLINNDNFGIFAHIHADGDAIGACVSLCLLLRSMGKKARVFYEENFNKTFSFLRKFDDESKIDNFECENYICLDVSDRKRVYAPNNLRFNVCIDHHDVSSCGFSDLCYIDKSYSSTCEIIYELSKIMNLKVDDRICTCIYAGILFDTGRFKWSNVSERTFIVSSEIFHNVDKNINRKMFDNVPRNVIDFQSEIIRRFEYLDERCLVFVPFDLWNQFGLEYSDLNFLSSFPLQIKDINMSIVIKEISNKSFRVSIRSYNGEAIEICKCFGGGGHDNASGFEFKGEYEILKDKIIKLIKL